MTSLKDAKGFAFDLHGMRFKFDWHRRISLNFTAGYCWLKFVDIACSSSSGQTCEVKKDLMEMLQIVQGWEQIVNRLTMLDMSRHVTTTFFLRLSFVAHRQMGAGKS